MGKILELPDAVYELIDREAKSRSIEPADVVREAVEQKQQSALLNRLRARGRVLNQPRKGPSMNTPFARIRTKDGSLVSDQIIQERI